MKLYFVLLQQMRSDVRNVNVAYRFQEIRSNFVLNLCMRQICNYVNYH
jgi:hypothetical protein